MQNHILYVNNEMHPPDLLTYHQNGISLLVAQTSFHVETGGGVVPLVVSQ